MLSSQINKINSGQLDSVNDSGQNNKHLEVPHYSFKDLDSNQKKEYANIHFGNSLDKICDAIKKLQKMLTSVKAENKTEYYVSLVHLETYMLENIPTENKGSFEQISNEAYVIWLFLARTEVNLEYKENYYEQALKLTELCYKLNSKTLIEESKEIKEKLEEIKKKLEKVNEANSVAQNLELNNVNASAFLGYTTTTTTITTTTIISTPQEVENENNAVAIHNIRETSLKKSEPVETLAILKWTNVKPGPKNELSNIYTNSRVTDHNISANINNSGIKPADFISGRSNANEIARGI